jgi:hypothetical protein
MIDMHHSYYVQIAAVVFGIFDLVIDREEQRYRQATSDVLSERIVALRQIDLLLSPTYFACLHPNQSVK